MVFSNLLVLWVLGLKNALISIKAPAKVTPLSTFLTFTLPFFTELFQVWYIHCDGKKSSTF